MPNPHCHIRSVRPKAGGHIALIRPRRPSSIVDHAARVARDLGDVQGYVIFAWSATHTQTGFNVPHNGRFHPNILPTLVAEQLRSDLIGWPDTISLLEQVGLIRPDPPKGA